MQHYVREAGRDIVYVVELNPERLSTNFEDWIEKDLLKLSPWDIQKIQIKDYSAELVPVMTEQGLAIQVAWDPRSEMTLGYNDKGGKWTPIELKKFDEERREDYTPIQTGRRRRAQREEAQRAEDRARRLEDRRRGEEARRAECRSQGGRRLLEQCRGPAGPALARFRGDPGSHGGEGQEIISNDGEVLCTLNDGVEYVLRFGDLKMAAGDAGKDAAEGRRGRQSQAKSHDKDVQRYLFVMARFNEDAVKKPELADLPAPPEGVDEKAPRERQGQEVRSKGRRRKEKAARSPKKRRRTKSPEAKPRRKGDEKSDELKKNIAERKQIEAENQKKLDEYQQTLEKGRQTVKDLNLRFGDWYFVVPNDVFQKVRLGRDDVVKKKDAKATQSPPTAARPSTRSEARSGHPTCPGRPQVIPMCGRLPRSLNGSRPARCAQPIDPRHTAGRVASQRSTRYLPGKSSSISATTTSARPAPASRASPGRHRAARRPACSWPPAPTAAAANADARNRPRLPLRLK